MSRQKKTDSFTFIVVPLAKADGGGYWCEVPEAPGCYGDGSTPERAIADAREALESWVAVAEEFGDRPASSGQWRLRVPRSLHRRLHERAVAEGVSLNTLAVSLLAQGIGPEGAAAQRGRKTARSRSATH